MTIYAPSRHSILRKYNLRPEVRGRDYSKGGTLFKTHTPSKVKHLFDRIGNIASRRGDNLSTFHDPEPEAPYIFTEKEIGNVMENIDEGLLERAAQK